MSNSLANYRLQSFMYGEKSAIYADEDYVLASPLQDYPQEDESIKVDFLMMLFCLDGSLSLYFDDNELKIFAGDLLLVPPNVIAHGLRKSDDCHIVMVGYSQKAVHRLLTNNRDAWVMFNALNLKPIISYDARSSNNFITAIASALRFRNESHAHYWNEFKESIMSTVFFYVVNDIHVPAYDNAMASQHRHSADKIFMEFCNMLSSDDGCHRTVQYFADELCISPKYLSKIVKQYTGQPALTLILDHVKDKIRAELVYTDTPIKEIADRFCFDDYVSFCKFVRHHLHTSPQGCRNNGH